MVDNILNIKLKVERHESGVDSCDLVLVILIIMIYRLALR
jgi:hypothetical protein